MKQKNLLVLVGAPGSGKSTWAKEYIKNNPNGLCVSRDEVRFSMLENEDAYFAKENQVFNEFCNQISNGLKNYNYVIADATHLNQMSRAKLLNNIKPKEDIGLIGVVFNIPLETCLKRNELRQGRSHVPETALKKMYYSITNPKNDELYKFNEVWIVGD